VHGALADDTRPLSIRPDITLGGRKNGEEDSSLHGVHGTSTNDACLDSRRPRIPLECWRNEENGFMQQDASICPDIAMGGCTTAPIRPHIATGGGWFGGGWFRALTYDARPLSLCPHIGHRKRMEHPTLW